MQVYAIRNAKDLRYWARNRWATPRSVPDLYKSVETAKYQMTEGKVGWYAQQHPESYKPELVLLELNVRHAI